MAGGDLWPFFMAARKDFAIKGGLFDSKGASFPFSLEKGGERENGKWQMGSGEWGMGNGGSASVATLRRGPRNEARRLHNYNYSYECGCGWRADGRMGECRNCICNRNVQVEKETRR